MATYSSNTTIKIGSSITQSGQNWTYTVPANCYVMLVGFEVSTGFYGTQSLTIDLPGGITVISENTTQSVAFTEAPKYLPQGTVFTAVGAGILGGTAIISGILFTNTP